MIRRRRPCAFAGHDLEQPDAMSTGFDEVVLRNRPSSLRLLVVRLAVPGER